VLLIYLTIWNFTNIRKPKYYQQLPESLSKLLKQEETNPSQYKLLQKLKGKQNRKQVLPERPSYNVAFFIKDQFYMYLVAMAECQFLLIIL